LSTFQARTRAMNCTPRDKAAAEREKAVLMETQTRMLEQQLAQASSRAARTTESYAALEFERDQLALEVEQLKLATEAAMLAADADKKAAVSTAVAKVEADQEFLRKAVEAAMKRAAATVHGVEFEKAEVPVYLDTLAMAAAAAQAESETRATAVAQLTAQVSSAQAQRDGLERSLRSAEAARDAATTKVGSYRRLLEETVAKAKVLHARLQTDAAQAEQSLAVAVAKIASTESEASQVKEALQAMRADRDSQAATLATTTEDLKQSQRLALNLEKRCGAFFSEMAAANDRLLNSATDEEKLREHAKTLLAQTQALQKQLDDVVADRDRLVLKMAKVQSTHDSLTSNAVELQDQLTKALDDIMTMSGEYQQASINP